MSDSSERNKAIGFSRHVYEKLLAAYPKRFRELYGEEMVDLFEDECREQLENGSKLRLLSVWLGALVDLAISAVSERGRFSMGFSVVRWGGLMAVVGGFLLITSGLLMSWWTSVYDDWSDVADVGRLAGMLFLTGGPIGLIALIAGRGNSNSRSIQQVHISSNRKLTWTQRSAIAGFLLAILVLPATIVIVIVVVRYEFFMVGYGLPLPDSVLTVLFGVFGVLSGLGLPAATVLLGIAIWRSGLMGRWRTLPVIAGVLTILAPLISITVDHLIRSYVSFYSVFGLPLTVAAPQAVVGFAWMLLGLVLVKSESANQDLELDVSAV